MHILRLVCKSCGAAFESGIPLCREHVNGVKLRTLEVCSACGAHGDYEAGEYLDPEARSLQPPASQDTSDSSGQAAPDSETAAPPTRRRPRKDIPAAHA
jgi:hypothetical protein